MPTRRGLLKSALLLPAMPSLVARAAYGQETAPPQMEWLQEMLDFVQQKHKIPAMFVALGYEGRVRAAACCGVRKIGQDSPVEVEDRVEIGSISKSCVAIVTANLVAQEILSMDTTIGEVLTELRDEMNPVYKDATVLQLLKHIAGISKDVTIPSGSRTNAQELRYAWVRNLLKAPPVAPMGQYFYGSGYEVLAVMCEHLTKQTYEQLLSRYIFQPCGLTSGGMGKPNDDGSPTGRTDQTWGHRIVDGKPTPFFLRWNTHRFCQAGGGVSCTITDLCRYGNLMFPGLQGRDTPLGTKAFSILRTSLSWGRGTKRMDGAADGNYSALIVRNDSLVVAIHSTLWNQDGGKNSTDELVSLLDQRFKLPG